jgi:peptidoglycan/LPS O-acetylase OafA/YrhL
MNRRDPELNASGGTSRLLYLDVLRCMAILLVLGNHQFISPEDWQWGFRFFSVWQRAGWIGVDLFFCLSGFLIGGLLFKELKQNGRIDLRRFYIRRAFKIWPSYFVYLLVVAGLLLWSSPGSVADRVTSTGRVLWPSFLHVQNYLGAPYGHTWSLAVEEHFYLCLPLLLVTLVWWNARLPLHPMRGLVPLTLTIALACLAARIWTATQSAGFTMDRNVAPTHLRFDALLAGVALAYVAYFRPPLLAPLFQWRALLLIGGALCFAPAMLFSRDAVPFTYTYGFSLNTLGAMSVTLWAWFASNVETQQGAPNALFRGMALIGTYSYSIYLWHLPFAWSTSARIWKRIVPQDWAVGHCLLMLLYIALACMIGQVLYNLIEKPALAVRDRLMPSQVRPIQAWSGAAAGLTADASNSRSPLSQPEEILIPAGGTISPPQ